jgi:hypothetical protein
MVVAGVTAALPPAHRRATRSAGDCVAFRKPDSSVRSETPFLVVHIMRDGQTDIFERAVIWNSTESGNVARNSSNASTAQSTRCWLNALNAHRQILAVKLSASGEAGRAVVRRRAALRVGAFQGTAPGPGAKFGASRGREERAGFETAEG